MRYCRLECIEAIIKCQQAVLAKSHNDRFLFNTQDC